MRSVGALSILLALLSFSMAASDPSQAAPQRTWGVGWDAGLGVRYHFGEHWGAGLAVSPSYGDGDGSRHLTDLQAGVGTAQDDEDGSDHSGISSTLMMFRESRLGRWIGVGPFARLGFGASRYRYDDSYLRLSPVDPDRSSIDRRKSTSADVWLDVGLRPVFHFDERFTLETSLGVRVRRDHSETAESSTDTANLSTSTRSAKYEGTSWTVGVFGRDLGLAATMAFMIYL